MLSEIRITNFAVIETVTVPFAPGLNVLTGETGAGKSILIDAILLVGGGRAQTDVIRSDAETATVEAVFELSRRNSARAVLESAGIAADDGTVVIRRELARSGRHRAFVNDSPVTVGLLERLGEHLVEIHGQHAHQRLLQPLSQLELLDRFAGAEQAVERLTALRTEYRAAREELERLRGAERDRAQGEDLLRFQIAELSAARLRVGEEDELRGERRRLQHAERFTGGLTEVSELLVDDREAAVARLARAVRVLGELGRLDPAFAAAAEPLEAASAHIEEAVLAVRKLRDAIEAEPGRLEAIDERLDAIARLKRKYGDSEAALLAFRDAAAGKLERLERHGEIVAAEERRTEALSAELLAAAEAASHQRREAAARLGPLIQRELRELGMERARFDVAIATVAPEQISPRGLDRVEFQFSANPGEDARPLVRIASGGELSRTMLAVEVVLATHERVATMVFDEVDAGVGGRLAATVADKLATAGRGRQVLCVTHLAPIAARASHHLLVAKSVRSGRTRAGVSVLTGTERVEEIARMLGGERISDTARRHARELLAGK
ncbi:MAG: DNA repair protein RecN [Candidatus Rokuibacteriota bacterium]|nr:MAG: DNA repair protein RecN [Candidatus Rokubacteria bacterium]